MTFIEGALVDQHFSQRGRLGRLLSALSDHQGRLGIGVDENTALVVQGKEFRVVGDGAVTLLDLSASQCRVKDGSGEGSLAIFGVKMDVIPSGFSFRFKNGEAIPGGDNAGRHYNELSRPE